MLPERTLLALRPHFCQLIVFKYGSISGFAARERPTPAGRNVGASQTQKPRSGRSHVPWRAAARAERQR